MIFVRLTPAHRAVDKHQFDDAIDLIEKSKSALRDIIDTMNELGKKRNKF